jgi:hypothetical protein
MQCNEFLNIENKKILEIIKNEFVPLDFSNLSEIIENNYNETLWMDVYNLIFKCNLVADITAFDIILKKLSKPVLKFCFKQDDKIYIIDGNEDYLRRYVRYLVTKEKILYDMPTKYLPHKEYAKELLKFSKFRDTGIEIQHIKEDKYKISPLGYEIENAEKAKEFYENLFDAYNLYSDLKLDKRNFTQNIETAIALGRDTRMIATLSIILNSFDCRFKILEESIGIEGTKIKIVDENTSKAFQEHILFAYQFFRNVVNPEDKKNIAVELYNKQISPEVMNQFNSNMVTYLNVVENKDLVDWIITLAKESKYSLKITFDNQGVFNIEDNLIVTPNDAKEYYISYMENKKSQTALTIYRNTIITRLKKVWNIIKSKFVRG